MNSQQFPNIKIRSKNELAKHLSWKKNYKDILEKINYCIEHFPKLYSNHPDSKNGKYIRVAKRPLKEINKLINNTILKEYDSTIKSFIYWWIQHRSFIQAVNIHKTKIKRTYIKLDLKKFFEQISYKKTLTFFQKVWIKPGIANILTWFCCVPNSEYFRNDNEKVIARWFPTSSRLSVLCTIRYFQKLNYLTLKYLKDFRPKITVFVDDITISFNNIGDIKINLFIEEISKLSLEYWIELNEQKTEINKNTNNIEILWVNITNWKLSPWKKTLAKENDILNKINKWETGHEKSIKWIRNYRKLLNRYNK